MFKTLDRGAVGGGVAIDRIEKMSGFGGGKLKSYFGADRAAFDLLRTKSSDVHQSSRLRAAPP
jgi:hypothetical protein